MKLLYLSAHSILEYDELKLFTELGIDCFSHGAYMNPIRPHDTKRPPIKEMNYKEKLVNIANLWSKDNLHPELVKEFDTIMVMHIPQWIENNWDIFDGRRVIWRSIGQSVKSIEERIKKFITFGLHTVRYSPQEQMIPKYAGHQAIIRFYKDPEEYKDWTGEEKYVFTVAQSMSDANRRRELNYNTFKQVMEGFPHRVYGPGNSDFSEANMGSVSYEDLKRAYQKNRVFFYTGTMPASYTLGFIEAWMTGVPIVAIGPELAYDDFYKQRTYEVHKLIENGVNGYWSDNINELRMYVERLLNDENHAREIGQKGREKAISLFGKQSIKQQWKDYLNP